VGWPIYSTRFCHVSGPGARVDFQVPSGKRAVIRGVQWSTYASTGATIYVAVAGKYAWGRLIPEATGGGFSELWMVAYAGELISLSTTGADVRGHVAGFMFSDPPSAMTKPIEPEPPVVTPQSFQPWEPG
jgi:hypothetical protein